MTLACTYSPSEENDILTVTSELGFSPSALQRYALLLYVSQYLGGRSTSPTPIPSLIASMMSNLSNKQPGETFIVSSLVNSWDQLSRGDKMILSKALAAHIAQSSGQYSKYGATRQKVTIYKKNY